MGVHRFDFDGRHAYISPTVEGYRGNIVMILDLGDPAHPREVGRWWMPGQWTGGGEEPSWQGTAHRCHHPLRQGDRLYTSYWHGGFVILDIADPRRPREIGHFLPDVPEGSQRVQSNDVTTDDRGLFYLLDRLRGLTILERCADN